MHSLLLVSYSVHETTAYRPQIPLFIKYVSSFNAMSPALNWILELLATELIIYIVKRKVFTNAIKQKLQQVWRGLSYIFVISRSFQFFFSYISSFIKLSSNFPSTTSASAISTVLRLAKFFKTEQIYLEPLRRRTQEAWNARLAVKQFFSNATNANESLSPRRIISRRKASWDNPLINRTLWTIPRNATKAALSNKHPFIFHLAFE